MIKRTSQNLQEQTRRLKPALIGLCAWIAGAGYSFGAGETISLTLPELPQNTSITLSYSTTVLTFSGDDAGVVFDLSTQGTVSGNNIDTVLTDDPGSPGTADPTTVSAFMNTPPEITGVLAPDVGAAETQETEYAFTVTYEDDGVVTAVDVSTIDVDDVTVTGPGGNLTITDAGVDVPSNGTPRIATYTATPPGGTWSNGDNGTYTIALAASQIGDTGDPQLFTPAGTIATFEVAAVPVITSAPAWLVEYGEPTSYTIVAVDSATTFGATNLPDGLSINTESGEITGTPSSAGVTMIDLSATDSNDNTGVLTVELTVLPKALTVTSITAEDRIYDGTVAATLSTGSAALNGALEGDDVLLDTSGATGEFEDETVGENKTVTVSGLTLTGDDADNYELIQPTTTATINTALPILADIEEGTLLFNEGDSPKVITANLTVSHPDDAELTGATIIISANHASDEDILAFSGQDGITGAFNASTGELILSGAASAATYQAALRTITYQNTSSTPSPATRTITFQVDDGGPGHDLSNIESRDIEINRKPIVAPDTIERHPSQGTKVRVATLLANDSDPDSEALSLISVASESTNGGGIVQTGDWIFYTPADGFTEEDTFTYTIADERGATAEGTVTVAVQANEAPATNLVSLRMNGGKFHAAFAGIPGRTYTIQYMDPNEPDPEWNFMGTTTADAFGRYEWLDTPPEGITVRLYRAVYP